MPVWFRRTLLGLAVLVALAIGLAAWLVASFDPERYKGVAIDWMKTHQDRTLAIDGPIKLAVFPRLEVRLSRISLSEHGRADEFAALDEAELAVQVLPLLRGQVSVDRVRARGVRLAWLRDAKGRRNIDDLFPAASPASATPPAAAPAAAPPIRLDVDSIHLADVRARIKDEPAGIDGEVLLKELDTGRIASQVPSRVRMVVQLGLKAPALKGELRGACVVTPNLETGSLRLADMDLGYKGDAPSASSIDASVKGELAYSGATGAIEAKALALRASANAGVLKLADTRLDIGRFAHDPANKRIAIGQLNLLLKGSQGNRPLEMTLEWPELDVNGEQLKGSGISGQLTLGGELPLEARIRSGAPGGNFDNLRVPGFEARLSSRTGARKVDGSVRSDLAVQLGKQALVLEKLGVDLKLEDSAIKPLALTLQGQAGVSAQNARWNVAGQVNANGFAADGTANLTQTTPVIKANVRFESLDLNTLLPDPAAAGAGGGAATVDAPIDLSALRAVNGSFAFRAGQFSARQFRVVDALLDATLETGVLRVSALQGKVWNGAVEATALADARASRVAIKATATGINVQSLLKDVAAKDFLEGKGRVSADLDTAGRSVSEMKSRLKGQLGVQLRDGALKGVNLAKNLRQAKAALAARGDASQRASQTEKTDFSEMNVSFVIDSGVARSNDLDLKSPFLRLGGEGSIDIVKGRIDYTARTTIADTSKGQDGADLSALRGLTIPVKLSGPFDAVDWNIQWSAVAAGAVKNQIEGKLKDKLGLPAGAASAPVAREALKDKAQDKVKDKLKDLFK